MKPHEEEWELNDYGGLIIWVNGEPGNSTLVATFHDEARAKLAAQAPAMAKLLLGMYDPNDPNWTLTPSRDRVLAILRDAGVLFPEGSET